MKKTKLLVSLPIVVTLIAIIALFFWQFNCNLELRAESNTKKGELKEVKVVMKRLEMLEKESQNIKKVEERLYRRVPLDEPKPFKLIKTLFALSGEFGFKGVVVKIKDEESSGQTAVSSENKPESINLKMDFEGSFPQLLKFLQKVASLERIVKINSISIERKKETMPYQKISLDLVTYTFGANK